MPVVSGASAQSSGRTDWVNPASPKTLQKAHTTLVQIGHVLNHFHGCDNP
jgi:hypothetical protein